MSMPNDLAQMTGVETMEWLLATFPASLNPRAAESGALDVRGILAFTRHGITDTDVIAAYLPQHEIVAALPEGVTLAATDLDDFVLVGAPAWVGDPENRTAWVSVALAAQGHEEAITADHERKRNRHKPDGKARYGVAPHEIVTAIFEAGRGPTYARSIIERATRHLVEIDAFGFGPDITPGAFSDMAAAGITRTADLDAYIAAGLTMTEAIAFRTDSIAPAAVLMARAEGHPKNTWHDLLVGLPADWFRPLGDRSYSHEDADESYEKGLTHYLRGGGSDRYTLADLRYLADHGWSEKGTLVPRGLSDIGRWSVRDLTTDARFAVGKIARRLADHGVDWRDVERWAEALTVGKKPEHKTDTHRAPLLGWGKGRGPVTVPTAALDGAGASEKSGIGGGIFALVDAGLKPSHMAAYRKAGCTSIEQVLTARAAGITPAIAERLCKTYGRQPEPRWHKGTWVIDKHAPCQTVLDAWARGQVAEQQGEATA